MSEHGDPLPTPPDPEDPSVRRPGDEMQDEGVPSRADSGDGATDDPFAEWDDGDEDRILGLPSTSEDAFVPDAPAESPPVVHDMAPQVDAGVAEMFGDAPSGDAELLVGLPGAGLAVPHLGVGPSLTPPDTGAGNAGGGGGSGGGGEPAEGEGDGHRPDPDADATQPLKVLETPSDWTWWRHTILEVTALYTVVISAEIAMSGGRIGSAGVSPHPYWLIILPLAASRGVVAGFAAAAVGTLFYLLGFISERPNVSADQLLSLDAMLDPLLFFGVSFVVGEFRDVFVTRHRQVQEELHEQKQRNLNIRRQRDVLTEANKELEKRLVDQTAAFGNLIVTATRIESASRREIFEIALELIQEHCGASASVLVPAPHDSVDILCFRGWPEGELPRRLGEARTSEFVRRAVEEGRPLNGFAADETPPNRGPLVVAPLFDDAGVLKALVCLDDIPATRLNASTVATFLAIGQWVSAALNRVERASSEAVLVDNPPLPAARREAAPAASEAPVDPFLGTPAELAERLRLEYERCTRHGLPLAMVGVQLTEWTDASPRGLRKADAFVLSQFVPEVRGADAFYAFGFPGCYVLVLPASTEEAAEAVRQRLLERSRHDPSQPVGPVRLFVTGPDPETPDAVNLVVRLTAEFQQRSALPLTARAPFEIPEAGRVHDSGALLRRLETEIAIARTGAGDVQLISLRGAEEAMEGPNVLALHLERVTPARLRKTDTAYALGTNHCAVVLPYATRDQAEPVAQRLLDALIELDPTPSYGVLSVHLISLSDETPDACAMFGAAVRSPAPVDVPPADGARESVTATRTGEFSAPGESDSDAADDSPDGNHPPEGDEEMRP